MDKIYKTAIYLRLSRDDEGEKESGSISNQRQMLTAFVADREDLELVGEYVDDGYGGYDFDRPDFNKMLEKAKLKEIDCIVVKDLSRLGRNFQKTEEYIQKIFPKMGVRFIAISNCYDSNREPSLNDYLVNPMTNLFNEFHVAETSRKVRSTLEHYRRIGKFVGNSTVYGYVVKDKHIEVDETVADVVRSMFDMKIDGYSNQSIADYLNSIGVNSPLEHKLENNSSSAGKHWTKGEKALWSSASVRRVLENPIYIGSLVQGKTYSVSYRDKRRFKTDPSELAVFENSHQAIVSDTVFLIVQDLLEKDSYSKTNKQSYLFSSFAYCGNCGELLYHKQNDNKVYWFCKNKNCKQRGNIREEILANTVFEVLKKHMNIVLNNLDDCDFSKNLDLINSNIQDTQNAELEKQIAKAEKSKENLSLQSKQGIISTEDFAEMSGFFDKKIAKLKFEIEQNNKQNQMLLACADEIKQKYEQYFEMQELTRAMVVTFIEKIEVFSKTKIRIYFRYENIFSGLGGAENGS